MTDSNPDYNEINCTSFKEYQLEALCTLRKGDSWKDTTLHAIMGMVGEAGEFLETKNRRARSVGELGDCMWYAVVMAAQLDLDIDVLAALACSSPHPRNDFDEYRNEVKVMLWAGKMVDEIKKVYFYGKEFEESFFEDCLQWYIHCIAESAKKVNLSLLAVCNINLKKLATRYPDKMFVEDHAINRDYEAESNGSGVSIK